MLRLSPLDITLPHGMSISNDFDSSIIHTFPPYAAYEKHCYEQVLFRPRCSFLNDCVSGSSLRQIVKYDTSW